MAEFVPSPDFQDQIRRVLAAPDPDPAFAKRLGERLAARTASLPPGALWLSSRMRLAWAVALLFVLLLASLAIGPTNIVAAMQRLLGYVPGVGLVDDSAGLRVLAEPARFEREGIIVTVTQAVLDSERAVILFQVEGIPPSAYSVREEGSVCADSPGLLLPDGTRLQFLEGSENGWGSGYQSRLVFPAVPPQVDRAVFALPCLMDAAPRAAPENWELPLRFLPAPPDLVVVPVIDLTPSAGTTTVVEPPDEMGLVLERVIELQDAYILIGTFHQGDGLPEAVVMGISAWPEITDSKGARLPFETANDVSQPSTEIGVFPWAYEIPKGFTPPVTITLQAVDVQFLVDLPFQFDTGPEPQPRQEWILAEDFEVAGHTVRLVSAVLHDPARENGYEFFFQSDPAVSSVSIEDREHLPVGGYGGGSLGEFSSGLVYEGPVPIGLLTFNIVWLTSSYPGPWTLTWSPAGTSAPVNPAGPAAGLPDP